MSNILSFLQANWAPLLVALGALDSALLIIFPNAGVLRSIQNVLSSLSPRANLKE